MTDQFPARPIRLVLIEEPGLFRASLGWFLAAEPGFEVVGECDTYLEAVEALTRSAVDVVLLEFAASDSTDFMPAARRAGYKGRFLVIGGMLDASRSARLLKRGAAGIVLKSETPQRLANAIRVVAQGGAWVDQQLIHSIVDHLAGKRSCVLDPALTQSLDNRERDVLTGILSGLSNRKIAASIGLSENSVKNIVQRLLRRAGVNSRSQLVRVALAGPPRPQAPVTPSSCDPHRPAP